MRFFTYRTISFLCTLTLIAGRSQSAPLALSVDGRSAELRSLDPREPTLLYRSDPLQERTPPKKANPLSPAAQVSQEALRPNFSLSFKTVAPSAARAEDKMPASYQKMLSGVLKSRSNFASTADPVNLDQRAVVPVELATAVGRALYGSDESGPVEKRVRPSNESHKPSPAAELARTSLGPTQTTTFKVTRPKVAKAEDKMPEQYVRVLSHHLKPRDDIDRVDERDARSLGENPQDIEVAERGKPESKKTSGSPASQITSKITAPSSSSSSSSSFKKSPPPKATIQPLEKDTKVNYVYNALKDPKKRASNPNEPLAVSRAEQHLHWIMKRGKPESKKGSGSPASQITSKITAPSSSSSSSSSFKKSPPPKATIQPLEKDTKVNYVYNALKDPKKRAEENSEALSRAESRMVPIFRRGKPSYSKSSGSPASQITSKVTAPSSSSSSTSSSFKKSPPPKATVKPLEKDTRVNYVYNALTDPKKRDKDSKEPLPTSRSETHLHSIAARGKPKSDKPQSSSAAQITKDVVALNRPATSFKKTTSAPLTQATVDSSRHSSQASSTSKVLNWNDNTGRSQERRDHIDRRTKPSYNTNAGRVAAVQTRPVTAIKKTSSFKNAGYVEASNAMKVGNLRANDLGYVPKHNAGPKREVFPAHLAEGRYSFFERDTSEIPQTDHVKAFAAREVHERIPPPSKRNIPNQLQK